jgi:ElaB/YqjD/DUF883 family membrane-anchored ribosome-binding protein
MTDPIPAQIPPDVTDVHEQIAALRGKVDELMNNQVKPTVAGVADRAESLAHRATDYLEQVSSCVRERPLASIAVSLFTGYVIAALRRR